MTKGSILFSLPPLTSMTGPTTQNNRSAASVWVQKMQTIAVEGSCSGKGSKIWFWTRCSLCSWLSLPQGERRPSAKVPRVLDEPFVCKHIEKLKLWVVNIYCSLLALFALRSNAPPGVLEINTLLMSFLTFRSVYKCEFSLLLVHAEKVVIGLTAANISVYDPTYEPVILFGQANGVHDPQRFSWGSTLSLFNMFGMWDNR